MELKKNDFVIRLFIKNDIPAELQYKLYSWIKNFIYQHQIKSAINIEYVKYDGTLKGKKRRVQFFSKKEVEFLEDASKEKLKYIEVYKLDESKGKVAFHSSDFSFYFNLTQPFDSSSLGDFTFLLNYDYWCSIINEAFIIDTIKELSGLFNIYKVFIVYGIATKMPRHKKPVFFFSGIGNPNLTDIEMDAVDLLSRNSDKLSKQIWEPFWGNLITKNHLLGEPHLHDLEATVGSSNITTISENLLWYKLPISLCDFEYGDEIYLKYRNEIRAIFLKYNKVI
jgi:hypothetical protein